jgi:hypothetical protein
MRRASEPLGDALKRIEPSSKGSIYFDDAPSVATGGARQSANVDDDVAKVKELGRRSDSE